MSSAMKGDSDMGKRLISKDEQIKQLENETREMCMRDFGSKSFSIMYSAGVLMVSNSASVNSAMRVLHMAMEGLAEFNTNLPADVTTGYYETYNVTDKTVSNICEMLESIDSCIKCNDETRTAIVDLLNSWQINWITYRMKKASILGVLGKNCKVKIVKENGVNRIYVDK